MKGRDISTAYREGKGISIVCKRAIKGKGIVLREIVSNE